MPAYVIIDGQWGSTGKGKLAGYLAQREKPQAVACDFMSNAGHTWVGGGGRKVVTYHIPTGGLFIDGPIFLGPGCGITVDTFMQELEALRDFDVYNRVYIHPHALTIHKRHAEAEALATKRIASTMKGCGAALAEKVLRSPNVILAKDALRLRPFVKDTAEWVWNILSKGGWVQVEGAQGFGLSLDYGFYPYVTSRNVTPADILVRSGVPAHSLKTVWGCLRTYPIRVGNVYGADGEDLVGYSGGYFPDQKEITWGDVERWSGSKAPLLERTTVTGRVRRVFSSSREQLKQFTKVCNPTKLFLNFVNHIDAGVLGVRKADRLPPSVRGFIDGVECVSGVKVALVGTGPGDADMVERVD